VDDVTTTPPIADAPAEQVVLGEHTFTVRPLQPADRTDALALHERVFGPGADPAWHAWKYGRLNGEGHGVAMGAWRGTEMVAHCGGVPRTLHLGDRAMPGMQVGDVMVAPRWRGLLTRRGPFYQVSQAFYGRGWLVEGTRQVAFGFPNERHLKLALALKLVWNGGPVLGLEWTAGSDVPPPARWWRWAPLDPSEPDFDRTVSRAWLSMRAASGHLGLGQRDAPYVRWRFLHRPGQHCQLYALRRPWSSRAEGIAVLKEGLGRADDLARLDRLAGPDARRRRGLPPRSGPPGMPAPDRLGQPGRAQPPRRHRHRGPGHGRLAQRGARLGHDRGRGQRHGLVVDGRRHGFPMSTRGKQGASRLPDLSFVTCVSDLQVLASRLCAPPAWAVEVIR
jgi:hypothetical protein